jgi:hypothetical protein
MKYSTLFCAIFFATAPLSGAEERTQSTSAEKVAAHAAQTSVVEMYGWTDLHRAACSKEATEVEDLIKTTKFSVNAKTNNGNTPLLLATCVHWTKKDTDMAAIARTLLDAKAEVDAVDHLGNTALQRLFLNKPKTGKEGVLIALQDNKNLKMATVQTLVDYGADQRREFFIRYTDDPEEEATTTTPCKELRRLGREELPKSKKDLSESKKDTPE